MENIDKNDKKILSFLDQNSRVPLTTIAKRLKASPQVLKYHFDKLVNTGLIIDFWPAIDFRRIGYINISYFLKLKNISTDVEECLYKYLLDTDDINIAMSGDGFWDLHVTFSTTDIFSNQNTFEKFYEQFHTSIAEYKTAIPVGFYQFPRKYLLDKPSRSLSGLTGTNVSSVVITEIQKKILHLLNIDARLSYNEISNRIAVSRQTVVRNISALEESGIIQGYTIHINHEKMGLLFYRTLIQLKNFNPERQKELFSFCQQHPYIVNYLKIVGNWQLLLDIEVFSVLNMRELSRELREKFTDLIETVEPTLVYKLHKFRDVPKILT